MHACGEQLHACGPQEPKQEGRPHRDKSKCLTRDDFVNLCVRQSCSVHTTDGHLCPLQARQLQEATQEIRSARAPVIGEEFEHLAPSDDLNFTSKSWSITLDPKTGKILAAADDPSQLELDGGEEGSHIKGPSFVPCTCCMDSVCTKQSEAKQRFLPHNEHHLQDCLPRAWTLNAGTSIRKLRPLTRMQARLAEPTLAGALCLTYTDFCRGLDAIAAHQG